MRCDLARVKPDTEYANVEDEYPGYGLEEEEDVEDYERPQAVIFGGMCCRRPTNLLSQFATYYISRKS